MSPSTSRLTENPAKGKASVVISSHVGFSSSSPESDTTVLTATDPKKPRASRPKVKTGCKTCKIRRVKCDETKPQCLRCLKFVGTCAGYDRILPHTPRSLSRLVLVKPKPILPHGADPLMQLPLVPTNTTNSDEHQYFTYFREYTVPELSGGYDDVVWNRIVLQASHDEPAIHHFILAIGSYCRSHDLGLLKNEHRRSKVVDQRYSFNQYSKALEGIQKLSKSGRTDIRRIVLIASLLIYCFESLHRKVDIAVGYLKSALKVALRDPAHPGPVVYHHIERRPLASNIEDDLISAFARLEANFRNSPQNPDTSNITVLGIELDYDNEEWTVPEAFHDLYTARRYLEQLQHRARPNMTAPQIYFDEEIAGKSLPNDPRDVSMQEIECFKHQLVQWYKAYTPLYNFANSPVGARHFLAANILQVQALCTSLLLEGNLGYRPFGVVPSSRDRMAKICKRMLEISRRLVEDDRFSRGYMFAIGIIPTMVGLVVFTPERSFQEEAIRLLEEMRPRREGTWDSAVVAQMARGIMIMKQSQPTAEGYVESEISHENTT